MGHAPGSHGHQERRSPPRKPVAGGRPEGRGRHPDIHAADPGRRGGGESPSAAGREPGQQRDKRRPPGSEPRAGPEALAGRKRRGTASCGRDSRAAGRGPRRDPDRPPWTPRAFANFPAPAPRRLSVSGSEKSPQARGRRLGASRPVSRCRAPRRPRLRPSTPNPNPTATPTRPDSDQTPAFRLTNGRRAPGTACPPVAAAAADPPPGLPDGLLRGPTRSAQGAAAGADWPALSPAPCLTDRHKSLPSACREP